MAGETKGGAIQRVTCRSGAVATLEAGEDQTDVIRVRDARGRIVFELRDGATATITVPEGDLELRAEKGAVRIAGARGVHIDASTISLRAERLVTAAQVLETHAGRILERAKDVYREVDSLSQLRAGHVRLVAKKTFRTLAQHLRLHGQEDVQIDGEQIHLG